jgi:bacterioferritin-associated ferredoxin
VQPDDLICYCYKVSLRKLVHYARRERPKLASQMSDCLGAGTGCGWCIPFLRRIWNEPDAFAEGEMTPEQYAARRKSYIEEERPRNEF